MAGLLVLSGCSQEPESGATETSEPTETPVSELNPARDEKFPLTDPSHSPEGTDSSEDAPQEPDTTENTTGLPAVEISAVDIDPGLGELRVTGVLEYLPEGEGRCELALVGATGTVHKTAVPEFNVDRTECAGMTTPLDELGSGSLVITLAYSDGESSGPEVSKEVELP